MSTPKYKLNMRSGWTEIKEPLTPTIAQPSDKVLEVTDAIQLLDMPENAIVSSVLGDICKEYFSNFPRSYSWPAILTVAGTMVPTPAQTIGELLNASMGAGSQTNLYTALIGPVNSGKSQAIEHARLQLGHPHNKHLESKAGSAEGLISNLVTLDKQAKLRGEDGCRQALVDIDEWQHLFAKAAIDNASYMPVLNSAFNKTHVELTIAGQKKLEVDCAITLIGGMVYDKVQECFGSASTGGFYDRFLFGVCPTINPHSFIPFDPSNCALTNPFYADLRPVPVKIDKSVWQLAADWKKADSSLSRTVEVTIRCCTIIASFDGRGVIYAADLEAMRPFLDYQLRCRQIIVPLPGSTNDAKMCNAILQWLKKHADNGEWVNQVALKKGVRRLLDDLGAPIFERVIRSLRSINAIQTKIKPNDGARASELIRLFKGM